MEERCAAPYGVVREVEVHLDDLDTYRVLYHAHYVTLVDRALNAHWLSLGYFDDARAPRTDVFQLVREVSITFERPVRRFGTLLMHLWTEKVGDTSCVFGFRALPPDGSEAYAHGHRVVVRVDPVTYRSTPWTDQGRADLEALLRPAENSLEERARANPAPTRGN